MTGKQRHSFPRVVRERVKKNQLNNSILSFISYVTSQYKLHFYETPTNIKFVMITDTKSPSMRIALQQIYINLYVEYGR